MTTEQVIAEVARILVDASSVLFITGAGISADSGLPTYRGIGGLYNGQVTADGVPIEDALSGPMFAKYPELTWKYLWQIGSACTCAVPNAAHQIIAEIEAEKNDTWVITQNVDGLHRSAGSRNLIEIHGHLFDLFCIGCGSEFTATELLANFCVSTKLPPECPKCSGVIRPKVVLFDEPLPSTVSKVLFDVSSREFEVVFVVGTSVVFDYINQPITFAESNDKPIVVVNPSRSGFSWSSQYHVQLRAADAMQRIRKCMLADK